MKQFKLYFLAFFLSVFCGFSYAGSPRGLNAIVIATPAAQKYLPLVRSFVDRYNPDDGKSDCDNAQLNLEYILFGGAKSQALVDISINVIQNKRERQAVVKTLAEYSTRPRQDAWDGILMLDVVAEQLHFYGIPTFLGAPIQRSKTSTTSTSDQKILNETICRALIHIPVTQRP